MLHQLLRATLILVGITASALSHGQETRAQRILKQLYEPDQRVMVVAHRGDWRGAPENSLQAIENAIEMGVDIVEIDIRPTRDGHLVVIHDKTLDRTTTASGKVSHHTIDELVEVHLRNGYGMPTQHRLPALKEALEVARDRVLVYLDKSEELIPEAYSVVERLGMQDQVLFYGHKTAEELGNEVGDLSKRIHYLPKLGDATPSQHQYLSGHSRAPAFVTSFAVETSPVLENFAVVKKQKARIWASPLWSELCAGHTDELAVDDPDKAWGWLIERGATILCTDRPEELIKYLDEKGLR